MTTVVSRAKAYLKVRQKSVREAMKKLGLDALLLTSSADLAYLTNFTGDDSIGIVTDKDLILVTDFRYKEQAEIEAAWLKVVVRDGKMSEALAAAVVATKAVKVGFEANSATFGQIHALDKAMKGKSPSRNVELVPVEDVLVNIRKVKDDHEIDLIRKSVAIAEEAFIAIRDEIKVGQSENYLAGMLVFELRSRGASDSSFPAIVATGANSSLPHYRPGETLVQNDKLLLFDWGARYKGYCSDLTRTLLLGKVSAKMKQIYKVVLAAQEAAIEFLRPGVTTIQADRVARDVIDKAGFKEQFGHGLGHGIGRDIHELPTMRKNGTDEELRPGMIVTVEPGIYIPGEGGVRIEDDILITHSGCEVLSTLEKSLEGCHIE
jgi:Xaa-Pro aminopeptidase